MAFFTLRLNDDLAARFDAVAANVGGRSHALRTMIERVARPKDGEPIAAVERSRGGNRVYVRLTDGELSQLDTAASERGVRRSDWIAATIRARLPLSIPSRAHRQVLIDIRKELRSIGRNVNQAVHALHSANMEDSRLNLGREAQRVAAMEAIVTEQIDAIGAALTGDLAYWRGES